MEEPEFVPKVPRERILVATIDLIEKIGPRKVTTRAIAAAAEVNIAAINYYFASKDGLIEAALAASWDHAAGHVRSYLDAEPWDPREALRNIAVFMLEGGFRFPMVTEANFFDEEGAVRPHIATAIAALSLEIEDRLSGRSKAAAPASVTVAAPIAAPAVASGTAGTERRHPQLRLRVGAFLSALIFPPLAPACLPWSRDQLARAQYVDLLVEDLLLRLEAPPR